MTKTHISVKDELFPSSHGKLLVEYLASVVIALGHVALNNKAKGAQAFVPLSQFSNNTMKNYPVFF